MSSSYIELGPVRVGLGFLCSVGSIHLYYRQSFIFFCVFSLGSLHLVVSTSVTVHLTAWKDLSLTTFRHKLKTHLFRQSYPDIVL